MQYLFSPNKFGAVRFILLAVICARNICADPDDLVVELETSTNLATWEFTPLDGLLLRDGKAYFDQSEPGQRFFRLRIADAKTVAQGKLDAFRETSGPPLRVEDYQDLGLTGVTQSNLNFVNSAVSVADEADIMPLDTFQQLINDTVALSDPDVAAYAELRGLEGPTLFRLSGFVSEVKATGVDLQLLTLGRSEFLARDGSNHHAVIGPDGTITGSLGDNADGIDFDSSSNNHFEFSNPAPFASGKIWQLVVAAADNLNRADIISGANGPAVRLDQGVTQYRIGAAETGSPMLTRISNNTNFSVGNWMLYGGQIGMGHIQPIVGIYPAREAGTSNLAFNNETHWRLGEGTNGFQRLDGRISLAMAGMG